MNGHPLRFALLMVACLGLVAVDAAEQAAPQAAEAEGESCADCGPSDGPAIYPGEVVKPSADWDDSIPWGGEPPWRWYEDPASVNCEKAPSWCQGNATVVQAA